MTKDALANDVALHGTITLTEGRSVKVHSYTAPEDGFGVNTHIIELPHELVVVDA